MKLIRGIKHFPKIASSCVVTLGNFDGVHIAHQEILQRVVNTAKEKNAISLIIIFEPTPQEFFAGNKAPARLTSLREKLQLFKAKQIDYVWLLTFDTYLANLSAEQFIQNILLRHLKIQELITGDDFKFGKNRSGDFALLEKFAKQHHFNLVRTSEMSHQQQRVSSTRVRQALVTDNLLEAEQLLGRPYTITGRVLHGAKRGRQLGFPTANIDLKRKVIPLHGVYAVKMYIEQQVLTGIANIGTRPTVDGTRALLEVHLFNFNSEIYGHKVAVEFRHKIRAEQQFASLSELKAQIEKDVMQAKQLCLGSSR